MMLHELSNMQKYLDDKHLLLAVAVITMPALVVLIIQASTYPITLHSQTKVNKVLVKVVHCITRYFL